ncbi:MAG: hypothetical protein RRY20_09235 [Bilophila sp.]
MANEGYLGSYKLSGERAATDDHPVVIHALPLAVSVTATLTPGLLLKRADAAGKVAYAPWLSTDTVNPVAVVDDNAEADATSVIAVVHGCVKTRMVTSGDGKPPPCLHICAICSTRLRSSRVLHRFHLSRLHLWIHSSRAVLRTPCRSLA